MISTWGYKMENKFTPTPWNHRVETKISYNSETGEKREETSHWVYPLDGSFVCITNNYSNGEANAAHIVKCANLHDELVAMLEKIENCYENGDSMPSVELNELIKRAKGQT